MDERALAERLITYDTSTPDGIRAAAAFVKGWLEGAEIAVEAQDFNELPVLTAEVGPRAWADDRHPRPRRRRPRPPGAVRAAHRGRPADRPRRLRHEGRPRRDHVRDARPRRRAARAREVRLRARRGVRGHRHALDRLARRAGTARRLRDHRRADQPARRRPGQGRADGSRRRQRPRRARLDAVARRQRRAEGDRRLPSNRVAAVLAREHGAVRPPVDQPRPPDRRRRRQQGARRGDHGRRHPLPPRAGPGRDPRADPLDPRRRGAAGPSSARPPTSSRSNPYVRRALREAVRRSGRQRRR